MDASNSLINIKLKDLNLEFQLRYWRTHKFQENSKRKGKYKINSWFDDLSSIWFLKIYFTKIYRDLNWNFKQSSRIQYQFKQCVMKGEEKRLFENCVKRSYDLWIMRGIWTWREGFTPGIPQIHSYMDESFKSFKLSKPLSRL